MPAYLLDVRCYHRYFTLQFRKDRRMKADTQAMIYEIGNSLELLRQRLGWETAEHRLEELDARAEDPELWNDPQ